MPNITSNRVKLILDLPFAIPFNGIESTAIVQGGVTKQAKISDFGAYTKTLDYSTWVYQNSSVGTWVNNNSSYATQAYTWVFANSSYDTQAYTWVFANSSYSKQAYTWVFANSSTSTWVNKNSARILFQDLGGVINGNLLVYGSLSAIGATTITNLNIGRTSAIYIDNKDPLVYSLIVNQMSGSKGIATFKDGSLDVLHIGNATDIFGNQNVSGVVGIKTKTPNKTLTVNGDISANGYIYGNGGFITGINGANILDGTITSSKLTGTLNASTLIANNSIYGRQLATNADIVAQQISKTGDVVNSVLNTGISATQLASNAGILPTQLSTGKPVWDAFGNVGIGTSSPSQKLQVNGSVKVDGTNVYVGGGGYYYGDTNNLALRPATGSTFFQNNAGTTTTMYVDSNNTTRVGIGTTSPADKLHVVGGNIYVQRAGGFDGALYLGNSDTYVYGNTNTDTITLGTNNLPNLTINNGNIGIGTTTPATHLHINNSNYAAIQLGNNVNGQGFTITKETDNTFNIWTNAVGLGTSRFRIDQVGNTQLAPNGGNVGINNTNPLYQLDVNGVVRTSNSEFIANGIGSAGQFRAINGNYGFFIRNDGANSYFLLTNSGTPYGSWNNLRPIIINNANGNVGLVGENTANVGIGTYSPNSKLDVQGNVNVNGVYTQQGRTKPSIWGGGVTAYDLFADGGTVGAGNGSTNTINSYMNAAGYGYFATSVTSGGDVIAYSDERLKENVKTIENALDKVNQLRGVEYTRKKDGKEKIGVIAQEIEKILPQVVSNENEYKAVDYGNIVAVLIEAVKELSAEVKDLKEQLGKSK